MQVGCTADTGLLGSAQDDCSDCNVVWIVVDTTRADRLALSGADPSIMPALNALAERGTAWQEAWAQAPSTMLSVTSYFSGRHRSNHGQMFRMGRKEHFQALHPSITTVAEVLQAQGFQTVGLVGNQVIAPRVREPKLKLDVEQGFDQWLSLDDAMVAALDLFDSVADDPDIHLSMALAPGDIQFVHNHSLLHDREGFRDDPARPRHLLRLWLSVPGDRRLPPAFASRYGSVTVGDRGGIVTVGTVPHAPLHPF